MPDSSTDPFFQPYDREDIAYGDEPSAALAEFLKQVRPSGKALDLGAGAGRDTIALAAAGLNVSAVDLSERGLERVRQRANEAGLHNQVETFVADACEYPWAPHTFQAIVATTILDHVPAASARPLWQRICDGLDNHGFLYAEVHTTEDPGSEQMPGKLSDAPVSETAGAVVNYFAPNQLAQWAADPESRLRILRYEERLEWDYTHGPEHLHGKAVLLAVRLGSHPDWYGQPPAFPRR
tara:strand:- start:39444 stop:40157 length:714 start_codon:yes stop_codon:yes gene_type:complete